MSATFQVGARYWAQSAGDHNCVWWFTVIHRTAKFVTLVDDWDAQTRVGIRSDDQGEWTMPFGTYSMAPAIRASRTADDLPPSLRPVPAGPEGRM